MKAIIQIRLTMQDGPAFHHFYVGDRITLTRKDKVKVVGILTAINADTIEVKRKYGDRPAFEIHIADITAVLPDNEEGAPTNDN